MLAHEVAVAAALVAIEEMNLFPRQQRRETSRLHVHDPDSAFVLQRFAGERVVQEVGLLVLLTLDHAGVVGAGLLPGEFSVVVFVEVAGLHQRLDGLRHAANLTGPQRRKVVDYFAGRDAHRLGAALGGIAGVARQHPVGHSAPATELHAGYDLVVLTLLVERVRYLIAFDQLELDRQRQAAVEAQVVDLQEDLTGLLPGANTKGHKSVSVQHTVEVGGRTELFFPKFVGRSGKGLVLRLGARLDASANLVSDPVTNAVADPAVVPGRIPRASPHSTELAHYRAGWASGPRCPALQARAGAGGVIVRLGRQRGAADLEAAILEGFEFHHSPLE
ncbi:hypothetical protein FQZ97_745890 [compost metagenome]